jgi:hypothetical protein
MKRIWTIFGRIARQGFHTITMKRIWTIFGRIAGQGFHTFTVKRIGTIFGRNSRTGFTHCYSEENLDYFGRKQDRVSTLLQ